MIKVTPMKLVNILFWVFISFSFPQFLSAQNNLDSLKAAETLTKANEFADKNDYKKSNTKALQAANRFREINDWENWWTSYYLIFYNGYYSNDFQTTIDLFEKVISKIPTTQSNISAEMHFYLGYCYNAIGDIFASTKVYQQSLPFLKMAKDTSLLVSVYGNLGINFTQFGDYSNAINYLQSSVKLCQELKDENRLWDNLYNLGYAYFYKGDYKNAQKNYQNAQKLFDPKDGTFESCAADIYLAQKQFDKALNATKQSIQFQKKASNNVKNIADLEKLLGEIYLQKGLPQKALSYFEKILSYYKNQPNRRELGKLYIQIADAEKALKRPDKALKTYQKALQMLLPNFKKDNPTLNPTPNLLTKEIWFIEIFRNKGDCFFEKYGNTQQVKWLKLADDNYVLSIQQIENIKLNYSESDSKLFLGDYTQPFYEATLKSKLALFQKTEDKKYAEAAFQITQKANAFVLREMLNEQQALEIAGVSLDSIQLLRDFNNQLVLLEYKIAEHEQELQDSLQNVLFDLKETRQNFKKSIAQNYPKFPRLRNDIKVATTQAIQEKLAENQLLVKYFLGKEKLYIFSISQQNFKIDTISVSLSFNDLIQQYRKTISDLEFIKDSTKLAEQQFLFSAHQLYQILLQKPLSFHNQQQKISRLIIVADGILNTIPFQTLLLRESKKWTIPDNFVIADYAISYAYYCRMLLQKSKATINENGFISFGLEFDDYTLNYLQKISKDSIKNKAIKENLRSGELSKLPFSDDEAAELAKIMSGKSWLNEVATKTNFLQNIPRAAWIHIASHSILDGEHPKESAIIFHKTRDSLDNLLRLAEIYQLQLNSEMIVLSACNTGFGKRQKGEGVNSIARAFNFSGVPAVVSTFWNISDETSKKMMELYYEYLKEGFSKDIALQKAQLTYLQNDQISSPAFRLPVYWSAWTIIGNNCKIETQSSNHLLFGGILILAIVLTILFILTKYLK